MKYFLIFSPDQGNREDCNVYYSNLVIANSEDEAKEKYKIRYAKNSNEYRKKNGYSEIDEQILIDNIEFVDRNGDPDKTQRAIIEITPII